MTSPLRHGRSDRGKNVLKGIRGTLDISPVPEFERSAYFMICNSKYLYKIELVTASDVAEFNKIATKCPGNVYIVNGENGKKKLNAKSFLGVHLARMAWNEIYVETDFDCYFDFEKFICE